MPIFEYKCQKCNHKFEKLVLKKDQIIKCPRCGSDALDKLLSVFNASVKSGNNSSGVCESGICNTCPTCEI